MAFQAVFPKEGKEGTLKTNILSVLLAVKYNRYPEADTDGPAVALAHTPQRPPLPFKSALFFRDNILSSSSLHFIPTTRAPEQHPGPKTNRTWALQVTGPGSWLGVNHQ